MKINSPNQINIWPMLMGCSAIYCVMLIYIIFVRSEYAPNLLFYFTYMAVACSFFPLPTPQIVMGYAQRYDPASIAILGGIAFCISALIDYSLVTVAFRYERVGRIKATRKYGCMERLFNKCPFISLMIAAFIPIPLEPIKLTACANRYNRATFLLACLIGRTPRYYLLARLQRDLLHIPGMYLYGSILTLAAIEVIRRLVKRSRVRRTAEHGQRGRDGK
ncbi:VTT domain-containing protein [Candidatus Poribacteria bacterium]